VRLKADVMASLI